MQKKKHRARRQIFIEGKMTMSSCSLFISGAAKNLSVGGPKLKFNSGPLGLKANKSFVNMQILILGKPWEKQIKKYNSADPF